MIVLLACQDRLLTKERLTKLNIHVDDQICCLCDGNRNETQRHLFADCSWITEVRDALITWMGITLQCNDVYKTIKWIKRRRWRQFQKEIVAAVWGAMLYYTWQARNWKVFKQATVNKEYAIIQIQKEIRERFGMLSCSRKVHRCQVLIQQLRN
ncbi:uncharacterized protein LOC132038465 [Lycium ferocissimum]|uniref:uncharacterized protein LOC132038465 n=1 Tax=Lycium ferocissimum TaxID=112874 RepID=UPI002814BF71|nr:uncharacterized protein LOC132038465 [Lycium ferocissimum]